MARAPAEAGDPALGRRIASGAVLAAVAAGAVLLGGSWLAALVLTVLVIAALEWSRLAPDGGPAARALLAGAPIVAGAAAVLAVATGRADLAPPAVLLGAPLAGALAAVLPGGSPNRAALGVLWLAPPCALLVWLRQEPSFGAGVVLWLLAVVAVTDTAAYASGRLIGGARLAPRVSPGKTWAGLAGGIAGAGLVGGLGGLPLGWPPAAAALAGVALALVAQAGDLGESWLKRRAGVKDSGALLPGHGGILDRIDGLLPATSALGLLLAWLG